MSRESYICIKNEKTGKVDFIPKHEYVRPMKSSGVQIIRDIEPYVNIAVDGKVVGGRRQHRDMLRAHNCVELGNDAPRALPKAPESRVDMGLIRDIKRAMGKL